jgi:hypothetical protein
LHQGDDDVECHPHGEIEHLVLVSEPEIGERPQHQRPAQAEFRRDDQKPQQQRARGKPQLTRDALQTITQAAQKRRVEQRHEPKQVDRFFGDIGREHRGGKQQKKHVADHARPDTNLDPDRRHRAPLGFEVDRPVGFRSHSVILTAAMVSRSS